jgi:hypothetical protein
MTMLLGRGIAFLVVAITVAGHDAAFAQQSPRCEASACLSAREVLDLFEVEAKARRSDLGHAAVLQVLTQTGVNRRSRQDSVASGLERMILMSDTAPVRRRAAMYLTLAGSQKHPTPLSDAPERVVRVYRQSTDPLVRASILDLLFEMGPKPELFALLQDVARQPGISSEQLVFDHDTDEPTRAIAALARIGAGGREVLRDLHRTKGVRSARAAIVLERLSQRDYRIDMPVSEVPRN